MKSKDQKDSELQTAKHSIKKRVKDSHRKGERLSQEMKNKNFNEAARA